MKDEKVMVKDGDGPILIKKKSHKKGFVHIICLVSARGRTTLSVVWMFRALIYDFAGRIGTLTTSFAIDRSGTPILKIRMDSCVLLILVCMIANARPRYQQYDTS
jgi:hypothetical protein